jgi:hypothetical protein
MVYKIGTLEQLEEVKKKLPREIYIEIYGIVDTLDREYGADRNIDKSDGGYVVYADNQDEIKDAIKSMHLHKKMPELFDVIGDDSYINTFYLKDNEYGINFIAPRELKNGSKI